MNVKRVKTSNESKSHLKVRAGRRATKGTGCGNGLSRTKTQKAKP